MPAVAWSRLTSESLSASAIRDSRLSITTPCQLTSQLAASYSDHGAAVVLNERTLDAQLKWLQGTRVPIASLTAPDSGSPEQTPPCLGIDVLVTGPAWQARCLHMTGPQDRICCVVGIFASSFDELGNGNRISLSTALYALACILLIK